MRSLRYSERLKKGVSPISRQQHRLDHELLMLSVLVILAFVVPVMGIAFAIYVLVYAHKQVTEKWVKILAVLAIISQLPFLVLSPMFIIISIIALIVGFVSKKEPSL